MLHKLGVNVQSLGDSRSSQSSYKHMFGRIVFNGLLLAISFVSASASSDTRVVDAAMEGDREAVRSLLKRKANVNGAQGDGMTALHWAAYRDDVEMMKLLLAAGANVHAVTRVGAIPPLLLACANGNPAALELLLKAGANPNSTNANGTTALMIAAASGNSDAVKLLDEGADANMRGRAWANSAHVCASLNRAAVIKLLLARGAGRKCRHPRTRAG